MSTPPRHRPMRTPTLWLGLVALGCASLSAHAQTDAPQPDASQPQQVANTGTDSGTHTSVSTKDWLQAQSSRAQASPVRQTLSGPVLSKVHERYVKSFAEPIPRKLNDK